MRTDLDEIGAGLDARTKLLGDVAAALGSAKSLDEALQSLVSTLAPAYCDGCEVVMPDRDGTLVRVASGPDVAAIRQGAPIPNVADHPVRRVFESGRELLIDIEREPEAFGPSDVTGTASALGVRSAVLAPMTGRTRPLGVLAVADGPSGRAFDADDEALVPIIARLTGLAIENLEALDRQRVVTNRLHRVARVAAALNAADDSAQIGTAIVDVARVELGATTGLLYLLDGDSMVLAASSGYDDARLEGWQRFPLTASTPAADAWRAGTAIICEDHAQIVDRYPYVADVDGFEEQAVLAVPVTMHHERLGAAFWSFDRPRRFTVDDLTFLDLIADQVSAAIARVRAGRSAADQANRLSSSRAQMAALAGVGVIGTASGREDRILEANQTFLDMMGLAPIGPDGISHVDLTPVEWRETDEVNVVEMRRTGRLGPYEKEYLHRDGTRVPTLIGGATLGFDPFEWMVFVVDLRATRAAEGEAAKANERLVEMLVEQRRIADVLQSSLLPATLPTIDGIDLHAEHWPESDGLRVGGDFYDAFPITGDRWGLLIGDVCGKGVEAAAVTATARHTARAAAMHLRGPDAVLRWVHEAVQEHPLDTYCTVAFAALSSDGPAGPVLEVCLGGHPPGLVCHADQSVEELGEPGTLLGLFPPTLTTTEHELRSGDVVMFYTDGVTDAPGGGAMAEDELARWLCAHRDFAPADIAAELRAELTRRRPGGLRDDVATIILRVR